MGVKCWVVYNNGMALIICTTKSDRSLRRFEDTAKQKALNLFVYYYEDESPASVSPGNGDKILLRDPYNTGKDFSSQLQEILNNWYEFVLIDRECYKEFPEYEDKLFQAKFINKVGLDSPETLEGSKYLEAGEFPVIVKKRIGSRGRGIKIVENKDELGRFFEEKPPKRYIIQRYYPAQEEYRIIVLKNNVLGAVSKRINLKDSGKIGVKIDNQVEIPSSVAKDSQKLVKALKADFVGLDVILTEQNKTLFLEANLSPQFGGFTNVTGINVAKIIIDLVPINS